MTEVIMPKMGDAMEEGVLLEWLKNDGDKVKSGEPIGTIQTDKATLELESPGSGTLTGLLVKGGETIPVGQPIAAILKEGEKLPSAWGSNGAPKKGAAPSSNGEKETAVTQSSAAEATPKADAGETSVEGSRVIASPLARKIAAEKGIDLSTVKGTGPGGRITEKDVTPAPESPQAPKPASPQAPKPVSASAEDSQFQLNRLRQITAQRTAQSKQQVPHFYVTVEVDVEKILALRQQFEEEESGKVSVNDFVVKACALSLQQMPQVNATYQGESLLQFGAVNIGLAVALDDGLTLPVLHSVQSLSLREISVMAKELAGKARDNKLHPDELSGSTFSISNMGMLDVDDFSAIINQPNAAILAVSTARKKLVVMDEEIETPLEVDLEDPDVTIVQVRHRMNITGSFDHRVVDGAVGAKFMNLVRDYLENPTRLLG
ncbi:MAG: dihydrolipoamide acetyltransferase family protein [Fimbriimonadaceae bacterium]